MSVFICSYKIDYLLFKSCIIKISTNLLCYSSFIGIDLPHNGLASLSYYEKVIINITNSAQLSPPIDKHGNMIFKPSSALHKKNQGKK